MMLDARARGSSEARCVVGCVGQQESGCGAGNANRDKAWGRDGEGPHLELHVCLGELFCFLFQ